MQGWPGVKKVGVTSISQHEKGRDHLERAYSVRRAKRPDLWNAHNEESRRERKPPKKEPQRTRASQNGSV